jgi:hypothetical protein
MKTPLQLLSIIIFSSIAINCSGPKLISEIPVMDEFENPSISNLWKTDKIIRSDVKIQSEIFKSGHSAIKISLHTNDKFEAGKNGNLNSERAELTEARSLYAQQGKTYLQTFSMFIPEDFPIVDKRLVLAQWKQECPFGHKCDDNSPVLAIRYVSGKMLITQTIGPKRSVIWESENEYRNRWLDFKFRVCFTTNNSGRIMAYLNDSLIVDYSGPTAYYEDSSTGYPSPGRFYFKMGLYRDTTTEPMTIYIDNYSKVLLKDNLKP